MTSLSVLLLMDSTFSGGSRVCGGLGRESKMSTSLVPDLSRNGKGSESLTPALDPLVSPGTEPWDLRRRMW